MIYSEIVFDQSSSRKIIIYNWSFLESTGYDTLDKKNALIGLYVLS
jgi:hypothetical protein